MRRFSIIFVVIFFWCGQLLAQDIVVTKQGARVRCKLLKRTESKWAFQREDGTIGIFEMNQISKIIRGNHEYDLEKKIQFVVTKRRPYLPLLLVTGLAGATAYTKFVDYKRHHDKAEADRLALGDDYVNTGITLATQDMALGILSGLVCLGTGYIAFKPVEFRTAVGTFRISMSGSSFRLALNM